MRFTFQYTKLKPYLSSDTVKLMFIAFLYILTNAPVFPTNYLWEMLIAFVLASISCFSLRITFSQQNFAPQNRLNCTLIGWFYWHLQYCALWLVKSRTIKILVAINTWRVLSVRRCDRQLKIVLRLFICNQYCTIKLFF